MVPKAAAKNISANSTSTGMYPAATDTITDRLRSEANASAPNRVPPLRGEVAKDPLEFEQKWKIEGIISKEVKAQSAV
jgi:hypothetical protein